MFKSYEEQTQYFLIIFLFFYVKNICKGISPKSEWRTSKLNGHASELEMNALDLALDLKEYVSNQNFEDYCSSPPRLKES